MSAINNNSLMSNPLEPPRLRPLSPTAILGALAVTMLLLLGSGCSPLPRKPVPLHHIAQAEIPGYPKVRAWAGSMSLDFEDDLIESVRQEYAAAGMAGNASGSQPAILALSGGADYGAFGAGFLNGWTANGTRPRFKLVTGISTGAILAPFAFLGRDYDEAVRLAYTTIDFNDVYKSRGLASLWGESLADSYPLAHLLEHFITDEMIHAIGREHLAGRRLYVGTTNLDADNLVIWNMGKIAASDRPDACTMFRRVILASASIPGIAPPVLMNVEVNGQRYDEMHVDGGVKAQLFVAAATLNVQQLREKLARLTGQSALTSTIYVIRNTKVGPVAMHIKRDLTEISARALSSMIRLQANHDLTGLHQTAQSYGFTLNWVAIPDQYQPSTTDQFDQAEMNRLYSEGFRLGQMTDIWRHDAPASE